MSRSIATGLFLIGLLCLWSAPVLLRAQQNPIPDKFTNLQVLPRDISRAELVAMMRGFAMHTGSRCSTCHVGEEGSDLSTYDFASDARPSKAVARRMMLMVRAINGSLLEGVGTPATPTVSKVTCYTCHRGVKTPLVAPPPK